MGDSDLQPSSGNSFQRARLAKGKSVHGRTAHLLDSLKKLSCHASKAIRNGSRWHRTDRTIPHVRIPSTIPSTIWKTHGDALTDAYATHAIMKSIQHDSPEECVQFCVMALNRIFKTSVKVPKPRISILARRTIDAWKEIHKIADQFGEWEFSKVKVSPGSILVFEDLGHPVHCAIASGLPSHMGHYQHPWKQTAHTAICCPANTTYSGAFLWKNWPNFT